MHPLPTVILLAALAANPSPDSSPNGGPKADLTTKFLTQDYRGATEAELIGVARQQALEQALRRRLGDTLVNENLPFIVASLGPDPYQFLLPAAPRRSTQTNSLGLADEIFVVDFSVAPEMGKVLDDLEVRLRTLPRPRLLLVRTDSEAQPEGAKPPKGKNPKPSPAPEKESHPGDSFAEVVGRVEGKLTAAGWHCIAQDDVASRLKGKSALDLATLRGAGLVGAGDVVVFLYSRTTAESGMQANLADIHTEVSWRAVDASSGDLVSAGSKVYSAPTLTQSFERGFEVAATGLALQIQGPVLDGWRKHGLPTGGVVVVVNGVDFDVLTQLRDALGQFEGAKVVDASFNDGSAQVQLESQLSADRVADRVAGLKLGKGHARVSRVASGRVELSIK